MTVDELIRGTTIGLGTEPAPLCWAIQADAEPSVSVEERLSAVTAALEGCPPPAPPCGTAEPRYAGQLCGPATNPCIILSDEQLPVAGTVSALALDGNDRPYLLLQGDDGRGSLAHLTDIGWSTEPTPFGAVGTLFAAANGTLISVVYAPPTSTALWERDADMWRMIDSSDRVAFYRGGVARDDAGCLHAIGSTPENVEEGVLGYALHQDHWGFTEAVGGFREPIGFAAIALAPSGAPHIAYWGTDYDEPDVGWVVRWARPPEMPEAVVHLGSNVLGDFPIRLVVTESNDNPNGEPHLFFNRLIGDLSTFGSSGAELVYARRDADGVWAVRSVDRGTTNEFVFERCGPPPSPGRTCRYSYESVRPIDVVTSTEGDIRLFYTRYTVSADLHAECYDLGSYCHWIGPIDVIGTLEIAWPEGDRVAHVTLLSDPPPPAGQVAVGRDGVLHLALMNGGGVRYLRVGSASARTSR